MKTAFVKKGLSLLLITGVFLLLGSSPGWATEKKFEWRFSTYLSEKRAEMTDVKAWADRIFERSEETIKITIYPGGSLGFKPHETLRVMKDGFVESASAYDGYLQRDEPALGTLIVQGVFLEPADYRKVVNPLREMKKRIYARWGIVWVGMAQGFGKWIYVFSKKPIKSIDDMRGKKIRVWSKDQAEILNKLGASAQIIPQSEMYMALKTGVVDGALYPPTAAKALSLFEVVKYGSRLYPYSTSFSNYVVSKSAWEKLSDKQKATVMEAGDWLFEETTRKYAPKEKYEAVIEFLTGKGIVFLDPFPEEDRKLLRSTAWDVWKTMAEKAGQEAVENYQALKNALTN